MNNAQQNRHSFQPHDSLFADTELERRVRVFLATHGAARVQQIHVDAVAGQLILRGQVATSNDRQMVEECSRRVAGVLEVRNEIRVTTLTRSAQRAEPAGARPPTLARRNARALLAPAVR